MTAAFDTEAIRKQFPGLDQKQVFLDNAGGSQVLGEVINSICTYLTSTNVQLGATYPISQQSTKLYQQGIDAVAKYINADSSEVVLGSSTTQLFRNLSTALIFPTGSQIIVSALDHEANIAPWVQLATQKSLDLKWWQPASSSNPKLLASDLKTLMSDKTRLVACTHTSNVLGGIADIKSIAAVVHEVPGAMLCVDGVAFAPHRPLDVKALDVDFYGFSWYKVYGPHISMLYASASAQRNVDSLGHFFKPSATIDDKLGLAGANYELVASLPKVMEYLEQRPWEGLVEHEVRIQEILLAYLREKENVTIYGEESSDKTLRLPVVSFGVRERSSTSVVDAIEACSSYGIRSGHFYSKRLVNNILGLEGDDGVVRVSMVHYNSEAEIEGLIKVLGQVLAT